MRIIAGELRGRPLKSLKGDATRPTTDRVREALMSSLISLRTSFEGARVLDAFAGSGALGLEALSRGAAYVFFNEYSKEAVRIIQANLASLKIDTKRYRVRKGDAFTLPKCANQPYDLVFLDPPYAYEPSCVFSLIADLDNAGLLASDALICYEYAKKDAYAVEVACNEVEYRVVSAKTYGGTALVTLRKEEV